VQCDIVFRMRSPSFVAMAAVAAFAHGAVQAQPSPVGDAGSMRADFGLHAVGLVTHASPSAVGRSYTEGYLTQPLLMGSVATRGGSLSASALVMLEGLTITRGELATGAFGEGYVDRRHPHTYLHEVVATAQGSSWGTAFSIAAGKGYVAFGSDDPMSRPFSRFPVNHHLAQLLERAIVVAGIRSGPALLEATVFNGDEPVVPTSTPRLDRFGDSWALRATMIPFANAELQASHARVRSPEYPPGPSLDHRKSSVSLRLEGGGSHGWPAPYAMIEWARTDTYDKRTFAYRLTSALGEMQIPVGDFTIGARVESTLRPEEERLLDPFRTAFPHAESRVLGLTRWTTATIRVAHRGISLGRIARDGDERSRTERSSTERSRVAGRGFEMMPFAEATRLHAHATVGSSLFDPATFYGRGPLWQLSLGVRMGWGMRHERMGRYGVAAIRGAGATAHHGMDHE
jgi:hypothetical protein